MVTITKLPPLRLDKEDVMYPVVSHHPESTNRSTWYVFRGPGFWFADTASRDDYGQDAIASVEVTLPMLTPNLSEIRASVMREVCRHAETHLGEA